MSSFMEYRGYIGSVVFSAEDNILHGKLIGIKASISYEGNSVESLTEDFHNAVDEYLETCERKGIKPQKPYKGSFSVRIEPDLHRKAADTAANRGITLNAFVEDAIRHSV